MSGGNRPLDNHELDIKIDAMPVNSKLDENISTSDVQDDQNKEINKSNDDKSLSKKHCASSLQPKTDANPIKPKPDQEISVSNVYDDQEKEIDNFNNDKVLNQKVHYQDSCASSLDLKPDAMPIIPKQNKEISASNFQEDQNREFNNYNLQHNLNQAQLAFGGLKIGNITASNVQFGGHNTMHIAPDYIRGNVTKKKIDFEEKFKLYLESEKKLNSKDLNRLSSVIGLNWKSIGRCLDIKDATLDEITHNTRGEKLKETAYQMLRFWHEKSFPACTVGILTRAFIDSENPELIQELPLDE